MTVEHVAICNRCRAKQNIPENTERPVGWLKISLRETYGGTIDLCASCVDKLHEWIVKP